MCNKKEQDWRECYKLIEDMTKAKEKDGFLIYKSFYNPISQLDDVQLGQLFRALFLFQLHGIREVAPELKMAFSFFVNQFEIDNQKYDEICRSRSATNGGGRPKKADLQSELVFEDQSTDSPAKQDVEAAFNEFWDEYHEVTGLAKTDRDAALKHWKKLTKTERKNATAHILDYYNSLNNPKYCKKARTYLADKNFNDEYEKTDGGFIVPR